MRPVWSSHDAYHLTGLAPAQAPPSSTSPGAIPSIARAAGPGLHRSDSPSPWHPDSPLFWFGVLAAATFGLVAASTTVRVGPLKGSLGVGDTK